MNNKKHKWKYNGSDRKWPERIGKRLSKFWFITTPAVDVVLCEAEMILSDNSSSIGPKNLLQIWGFMSKFVMVDRFAKALGIADVYPGISVPKNKDAA